MDFCAFCYGTVHTWMPDDERRATSDKRQPRKPLSISDHPYSLIGLERFSWMNARHITRSLHWLTDESQWQHLS